FRQKAPNTYAYLDAGNAGWTNASTIAYRLDQAGIDNVRGFSVNVSNFYTTSQSVSYANAVNGYLGTTKPFVIDTSRNGNGRGERWSNPAGQRLAVPNQVGGGGEVVR